MNVRQIILSNQIDELYSQIQVKKSNNKLLEVMMNFCTEEITENVINLLKYADDPRKVYLKNPESENFIDDYIRSLLSDHQNDQTYHQTHQEKQDYFLNFPIEIRISACEYFIKTKIIPPRYTRNYEAFKYLARLECYCISYVLSKNLDIRNITPAHVTELNKDFPLRMKDFIIAYKDPKFGLFIGNNVINQPLDEKQFTRMARSILFNDFIFVPYLAYQNHLNPIDKTVHYEFSYNSINMSQDKIEEVYNIIKSHVRNIRMRTKNAEEFFEEVFNLSYNLFPNILHEMIHVLCLYSETENGLEKKPESSIVSSLEDCFSVIEYYEIEEIMKSRDFRVDIDQEAYIETIQLLSSSGGLL